MNKDDWNEENLEALFKQVPKVEDLRTKDELFQRLQNEGAFDEEPQEQPDIQPKGIRWVPLLASIASLFFVVLIATQLIGNRSISDTAMDENAENSSIERAQQVSNQEAESADQASSISSFSTEESMPMQSLVYESQLEGVTLFTIGLAGDDAESVPVSILIPNDVVAEKTGSDNPTKLQLYETFAPIMDEQQLGFNEYHPFAGEFREQGKVVIHQLPDEHLYDAGSASLSNYTGALIDTFGNFYDEVKLVSEDNGIITLDHMGKVDEPISITGETTQYNYFSYQMRNGSIYLSPNFRMSYKNVKEALLDMATEANDIYRTAILSNVSFKVKDEGDIVVVTFDEMLDLEQQDPMLAMRMIEAIVLTGASFDKQVNFEHVAQQEWNGFNFSEPLEKPVAANLIYYDF